MVRNDREFIFDPASGANDSPVAAVIELTGRKWTRSIIEHLLVHDSLRYNELREQIKGISDKVLSESLKDLEDHQLVRRNVIDDRPVKVEYSLTEAGAALEAVMDAVSDWVDIYLDRVDNQ
ncbi:winged helix-turn-helix transcriptional regulator (plasmid) [Haloferacaceae archaeon DSL9]